MTANDDQTVHNNIDTDSDVEDFVPQEKQNVPQDTDQSEEHVDSRNPERTRQKPKHLNEFYVGNEIDDHLHVTLHYCFGIDVPSSYKEAINSKESKQWQNAMDEEMRALKENDTFELTTLPPDRETVGGRWVCAIKTNQNDEQE